MTRCRRLRAGRTEDLCVHFRVNRRPTTYRVTLGGTPIGTVRENMRFIPSEYEATTEDGRIRIPGLRSLQQATTKLGDLAERAEPEPA